VRTALLPSRQLDQHDVRILPRTLEQKPLTVRRYVKALERLAWPERRQLTLAHLRARL
jgi:hypothetical protein